MIEAPKRILIPLVTLAAGPLWWLMVTSFDEDGFVVFFLALPCLVFALGFHQLGFIIATHLLLKTVRVADGMRDSLRCVIICGGLAAGNVVLALLLVFWLW
ncbi:MAG: hypothetical protein JSV91_02060 [Phycisphaerales bacterium]|nr:MAG: hypothetical protein JSV91_02060 [Phycisphaerales bacterium]